MKGYLEKHHRTIGGIGAVSAFAVAVIYLVVVPAESSSTGWIQKIILLYGHSLCWLLLGAASLAWSVRGRNRWSAPLAYVALTVYIVFMGTLLFAKNL